MPTLASSASRDDSALAGVPLVTTRSEAAAIPRRNLRVLRVTGVHSPGRGSRSRVFHLASAVPPPGSDLGATLVVTVADPDLVAQPHQRVVLAVHDPLLHRDDPVVGDLDALRAHL